MAIQRMWWFIIYINGIGASLMQGASDKPEDVVTAYRMGRMQMGQPVGEDETITAVEWNTASTDDCLRVGVLAVINLFTAVAGVSAAQAQGVGRRH